MSFQDTRGQLQKLAARLQAALQCREIYPPKHPRLQQAVEELYEELGPMFSDDEPLRLAYASGGFVVGNAQIPVSGEVLIQFGSLLRGLGIEKLVFDQAVSRSELREMLDILGRDPTSLAAGGGVQETFERSSITHITVGSIHVEARDVQHSDSLFRTWEAYSAGLHIMRGIKSRARRTGEVCDVQEVRRLALDLTALAMKETRPLLAVHALMQHDDYSFTHSLNVAMLTLALAQNLPFKAEELHDITVAALLHDVGKERIPGEILRKPGKLTPEEWEIVNTHGLEGARILSETEGIGDLAPLVAYEHHLAYHEELRDDDWEPHLVSQLVSIADVYDALRSVRPYRGEIPPDEAMRIMEADAGTKFEPSLFAGFKAMVGLYPPGTVVRLASGRLAVSFASNAHAPQLPQVAIVRNADGSEADGTERLDLAAPAAPDAIAELVAADAVGIEPLDYL
ncbi:MAG TPA: HD domain-containing phosphohydrolase [Acidobacteriota bacterium]